MLRRWADYSFARPQMKALKDAGITGVFRYLCPDTPSTAGKLLREAEKNQLLAAGFDITLNFEWYEGRCNEGGNAGTADANTALTQARALGYPKTKCIYFSHDTGVYDWAMIFEYYRSIWKVFGNEYTIGAYGSYELIQRLHAAGLIDYGWQTTAWSDNQRDPWAVVYQDGKAYVAGTDDDVVTSTDIGSWLDGPAAGNEGLMAVTDLQWNDVQGKVDKGWVMLGQNQDLIQQLISLASQNDKRVAVLDQELADLAVAVNQLTQPPAGATAKDVVTELVKVLEAGVASGA